MAQFGNTRGRGGQRGGRGGRGGGRGGRGGGKGAIAPKLPAELREKVDGGNPGYQGKPGNYKKDRDFSRPISDRDRDGEGQGRVRDSESRAERPRPQPQQRQEAPQAGPSRLPYKSTKAEIPVPSSKKKEKAVVIEEAPPKKKKRELRLPNAPTDDKEDGEIEWLEYILKNEKGKGKEEESDGLDDLLDFADMIGPGGKGLKRDRADSDEDEDDDDSDEDEDDLDDMDLSVGSEMDAEEDEDADTDPDDLISEGEPSELDDGIQSSQEEAEIDLSENEVSDSGDLEEEEEKEAAAAAAATKYVPPHMRAAQLAEKAQGSKEKALSRQKLERKLQGLLNKLSEANMDSIIGGVEEIYRDNSRNDVTTTITDLVLLAVSSKANLLDSFVSLYAVFVGALHRIIGVEFGAHFLHTLIMRYKNPSSEPAPAATIYETPDASKESLNLLTLVAELYNVGVVGPKLIYDLIREFIDHGLEEVDVEGLLKIVKRSGSQLRSEDPGSLKDITNLVLENTKGKDMTVRTKFMLETLTSLKSAKKEPNRFLSSLGKKRRLLTNEPLRVSLNDLLQSDTRGKWWLVGAGWQGNPLLEVKPVEKQEDGILEMARQQGMNTDVRRSIFVILMTSEDFVHACDRMNALKYSETQQREYVRVTLHCCNLEKTYNPYYTLVLNHLCSESYSHRFTLQYALWDLLRESAGSNVAKTMAYIIARGSMDLTVFKAIDFTTLKKTMISFFKTLLPSVILATQTTSPLLVLAKQPFDKEVIQGTFEKTLANPELAQGLAYVITRYGGKMGEGLDERQAVVVKKGLDIGKKVLARSV